MSQAKEGGGIDQVVTMLENIVEMLEAEGKTDQEEHNAFLAWEEAERTAAETHVGQLQTEIQTTEAALADLRSQKTELTASIAKIVSELEGETTQLNSATTRRSEENAAFVTEQQNFENAIGACGTAAKLLAEKYGGGKKQELSKPDFMSLINKAIRTVHEAANSLKLKNAKVLALMQGPFDTYKESSDEGGNIVDQINALKDTFSDDKQSAVDQENQLQSAFNTLAAEKQELIRTLTGERDTQQTQLNSVNQEIAEKEGSLAQANQTLSDRQAYLKLLAEQLQAANEGFAMREADRKAEKEAVTKAKEVLGKVSLIQTSATAHVESEKAISFKNVKAQLARYGQGESWAKRLSLRARHARGEKKVSFLRPRQACRNCAKAASLLRQKATVLHSATLSTAAAATSGNEQLQDVIQRLQGLIANLEADQKTETEHKEWCETEISRMTTKRTGHQTAVEQITQTINSLSELIDMKRTDLAQNQNDIDTENTNWQQLQEIREADKREYDEDLQDTTDAIAALNEAIDILAKFYASRAALVEIASVKKGVATLRTDPNSGSQVVTLMRDTRGEFTTAEAALRKGEQEALELFAGARADHIKADNDLEHARGVLTVEKQTAEAGLQSNKQDLETNNNEIAASTAYLGRLDGSCKTLIDNYDRRVSLRNEEKTAIEGAINTIKEVA